jgi:N-acetylmuramoyl-L-alanine amidase
MGWKLTLLGIVVCAVTALVVRQTFGDSGRTTTKTVKVVLQKRAARTRPAATSPKPPQSSGRGEGSDLRGGPEAKPSKTVPPPASTPHPSRPLEGVTISVDPGHNGGNFSDPEAIDRLVPAGANGTMKPCNTTGTATDDGSLTEAQFNWDVAQDVVPRLEHLGATVVLTRHSNDGVGPCVDERAEIANRAHAAVALSIHADGNLSEGAHGFDVIHPATAEMVAPEMAGPSLRLAQAERNALVAAGIPPANYVGSEGLDERSDLAGLNLAKVPAVLVELGNMREPGDAARLEDPAYRNELADALATGIVSFLHRP